MGAQLFEHMIQIMGSDYKMVYQEIVLQRHQLTSDKIALFGVSLGVILSGSIFVHEGFGQRLLGTIGHFDIPRFARSCIFVSFYFIYFVSLLSFMEIDVGALLPTLASSMVGASIEWLLQRIKPEFAGYIPLLRFLPFSHLRSPSSFLTHLCLPCSTSTYIFEKVTEGTDGCASHRKLVPQPYVF
jgi:hypothetical protein